MLTLRTQSRIHPAFKLMAQNWLRLSQRDVRTWWQSIEASTWSHACEFRERLVAGWYGVENDKVLRKLVHDTLNPHTLVRQLELLEKEQLLSADEVRKYTDAVLRRTNQHGHWKD